MRSRLLVLLLVVISIAGTAKAQTILDIFGRIVEQSAPQRPTRTPRATGSELTHAMAVRLQAALKKLGYYQGAVDGRIGPGTRTAFAMWARDRGWDVPETIRSAHLEYMEKEVAQLESVSIEPASQDLVRRAQTALIKLGYYSGEASGVMDQHLALAIANWARDRGWAAPDSLRAAHIEYMEKEAPGSTGLIALEVPEGDAKIAQRALSKLGFYTGPIDGRAGVGFSRAISAWASANGWNAPETLRTTHVEYLVSQVPEAKDGDDVFFGSFQRASDEATMSFPADAYAVSGSRGLPPPPTAGPAPIVDPAVGWRKDDTLSDHHSRLRERARSMAGSCEAERAELQNLASTISLETPPQQKGRVGDELVVTYSGNTLTKRIPAWIVVATEQPVRFRGSGHFDLGPDSPNPFGIAAGKGQHRALVSLPSRGAGESGSVPFSPLAAGELSLSVSLVGFLRNCDEEVELKRAETSLEIDPDSAEIVLNTAEGRAAYNRSFSIQKFGRRVELNATRVLLLDAKFGTEIVDRPGRDIQVSPTHRYLALTHNEKLEIVDVLDGRTVAVMDNGEVYWALGDSVVVTTSAPWAEINLRSTFGEFLSVSQQVTGPSCCSADPDGTRVGVDLENTIYSIWGKFGHRLGSLQNGNFADIETSSGAYSSSERGNLNEYLSVYASVGMVAPVSQAQRFDFAGGVQLSKTYSDMSLGGTMEQDSASFDKILDYRLARVGLSSSAISPKSSPPDISATATASAETNLAEAAPAQLRRLGIELDSMISGEEVLIDEVKESDQDFRYRTDYHARIARSEGVMKRFASEAKAAGWKFEWSLPDDDGSAIVECYHVVFEDMAEVKRKAVLAPRDVTNISRVETGRGALWAAQARCSAGATFGSLRSYTAVYFMDMGGPIPKKRDALITESAFFYENNAHTQWYDHPFLIKANDTHLLTYAVEGGVITVWDRNTQTFLFKGEDLPNGDLLLASWLTSDRRHVVQLNSDGNFYFHAIETGGVALFGRIVDDEIAVWSADFHYDATAEAAALIDLKFPGGEGQFSLDRFGTGQRVAGLARQILVDGKSPKSEKELGVPPTLPGKFDPLDGSKGRFELSFKPGSISKVAIFQDGVLSDEHSVSPSDASATIEFHRLKDAFDVAAVATDVNGLASLPVLGAFAQTSAQVGKRRALVVGVNTYEHPDLPSLSFALSDANTVREALVGASAFEVAGLKDRQATPEAIMSAVAATIDGLEKGDRAVIFFAGHGLRDDRGRFYLGTSRTDPTNLASTALAFDRLAALIEASQAQITVLLDACHSGVAGSQFFATNDDFAAGLSRVNANITLIAAAKGRQVSLEAADAGGGLFSGALRTVLVTDRDRYDIDGDSRLGASEVYQGIKSIVAAASDGRQTP